MRNYCTDVKFEMYVLDQLMYKVVLVRKQKKLAINKKKCDHSKIIEFLTRHYINWNAEELNKIRGINSISWLLYNYSIKKTGYKWFVVVNIQF